MYISEAENKVRTTLATCKRETGVLVMMLFYGVLEKKKAPERPE